MTARCANVVARVAANVASVERRACVKLNRKRRLGHGQNVLVPVVSVLVPVLLSDRVESRLHFSFPRALCRDRSDVRHKRAGPHEADGESVFVRVVGTPLGLDGIHYLDSIHMAENVFECLKMLERQVTQRCLESTQRSNRDCVGIHGKPQQSLDVIERSNPKG